jgi:hypothetical protein
MTNHRTKVENKGAVESTRVGYQGTKRSPPYNGWSKASRPPHKLWDLFACSPGQCLAPCRPRAMVAMAIDERRVVGWSKRVCRPPGSLLFTVMLNVELHIKTGGGLRVFFFGWWGEASQSRPLFPHAHPQRSVHVIAVTCTSVLECALSL